MHQPGEEGVNEVLATILLVLLVVALAAVILSIALGWVVLQPKSAYTPPGVKVLDVGGEEVISLTSKGGDPAVLWPGRSGEYSLSIHLDSPGESVPVIPGEGVETFYPGQTLYIYNDGTALRAGYNLPEGALSPLPSGPVTLRIVDENAKLLVYREGLALGGGTVSPTPTCTLGTGWEIRNKRGDSPFEYTLYVQGSSGEIISQGVIGPAKVIRVWYTKQSPYTAALSWNATPPPPNTVSKENIYDVCEFAMSVTGFPSGGAGQAPLELQAVEP